MKVKELMEMLSSLDGDMEICISKSFKFYEDFEIREYPREYLGSCNPFYYIETK